CHLISSHTGSPLAGSWALARSAFNSYSISFTKMYQPPGTPMPKLWRKSGSTPKQSTAFLHNVQRSPQSGSWQDWNGSASASLPGKTRLTHHSCAKLSMHHPYFTFVAI